MISKRKTLLIGIFVALLLAGEWSKNVAKANNGPVRAKKDFRVVGYLPRGGDLSGQTAMPILRKITHLNIAFMNPDSIGVFPVDKSIDTLTALAHANGVSVLLSIGGGNAPDYLKTLLGGSHQDSLVQALAALTERYSCDGIDVDLEGHFIDSSYESFVKKLAVALKTKKKLITAAIATAYSNSYTDAALAQFDFVNVMSYDKTGPWSPSKPGPHAPLSMAEEDLAYWRGTRGIPKAKITLGLPFYGYGFGTNAPESISYQDIVNKYPEYWNADQLTVPGGGVIYYNGLATIQNKTDLALKNASGVMIWQLLQDAAGDRSLLRAINKKIPGN